MKNAVNFTLFNVEIAPITAPAVVIESASHLTVVGGMGYFFDDDGREVHVSRKLKLAYQYENTVILQTDRGELYHLVCIEKDEKKPNLVLKNVVQD